MPSLPRFVAVVLFACLPHLLAQEPLLRPGIARKLEVTPQKEYHAVLMRALTWLTGGAEANDYVSVGRLANYFGFVRFRVTSAHTLSRGAVGQRTYELLDGPQRQLLVDLLDAQWPALEACRSARLRINRALEGLLVGRPGTEAELVQLGAGFGQREAELGLAHAQTFARIAALLTPAQRQALLAVRGAALAGQLGRYQLGEADRADLERRAADLSEQRGQEFWNLASRLCSWLTGTEADDVYDTVGKPSQHFGDVDLRIESGHGATRGGTAHEVEALLTQAQQRELRAVVDANADDFAGYGAARAEIVRCFRAALTGAAIDAAAVRAAGRRQGEAEARMTWRHAQAFLRLRDGLTRDQADAFVALRARLVIPAPGDAPTAGLDPDLADGDKLVLAGQRVFALCALCHAPATGRGVGPDLAGVVGRRVASAAGHPYSPAMRARGEAGETWTVERLDAFLSSPQRHVPGTFMGFTGLPSAEQRRAVIAFLQQHGNAPSAAPMPAPAPAPAPPAAARPNFVFVLFEGTGAGWASTSVAMDDGAPDAKAPAALTPNLTQLAADGMRFAEFHVSAPRCTPARATFLTGIGAAKLGMTYVHEGGVERRGAADDDGAATTALVPPPSRGELPPGVRTVGDVLRTAGYGTAHFGKWHVGREEPGRHGFDADDGANTNQGPERGEKPNPLQAFAITERGLAFVDAEVASGRPFYLQLSHYGGGSEDEARPETRQALAAELRGLRPKAAWQAAILHDIDAQVGRLLLGLDARGLRDNTYVIVSFDHGASGRAANAPLRGGKGSVYEGGVRVPFLVRGPGVAAGVCSHVRGSGADLLPTLAALAGARDVPQDLEGGSLAGVLLGGGRGEVRRPRDEFVVHFPHYDLQNGGPASAIWLGSHKLVRWYESGRVELFDLAADLGEQRDLAAQQPQRVRELELRLDAYLRAIGAGMPTPR